MVHSICIYVLMFVFIFIYATACWLPKLLPLSGTIGWIYSWMESLESSRIIDSVLLFWNLPYRSECVGKPCEMVTWPHVCYDVILKARPIRNLVLNCTHCMRELLKSGWYWSNIESNDLFSVPLSGGDTRHDATHWTLAWIIFNLNLNLSSLHIL